jgi:hypothetical protein
VGASSGAPVATGSSSSDAEASVEAGRSRDATVVSLALRFALGAPPFGLRRASLRARLTTNKQHKIKTKRKGDTLNEVKEGTF